MLATPQRLLLGRRAGALDCGQSKIGGRHSNCLRWRQAAYMKSQNVSLALVGVFVGVGECLRGREEREPRRRRLEEGKWGPRRSPSQVFVCACRRAFLHYKAQASSSLDWAPNWQLISSLESANRPPLRRWARPPMGRPSAGFESLLNC